MSQVSSSGLSQSDVLMLVMAMSMRNRVQAQQPTATASGSDMLSNSLGASMPSIGSGLSGLLNGASTMVADTLSSNGGGSGGLADRLGISQFFPPGFNPFSGVAVSQLVSMSPGGGGASSAGMGTNFAAGATVPSSPGRSPNSGVMAALAVILANQEKDDKAKT